MPNSHENYEDDPNDFGEENHPHDTSNDYGDETAGEDGYGDEENNEYGSSGGETYEGDEQEIDDDEIEPSNEAPKQSPIKKYAPFGIGAVLLAGVGAYFFGGSKPAPQPVVNHPAFNRPVQMPNRGPVTPPYQPSFQTPNNQAYNGPQTIPGSNIPGQNVQGPAVPGQPTPGNPYQNTAYQTVPGQNIPGQNFQGQNFQGPTPVNPYQNPAVIRPNMGSQGISDAAAGVDVNGNPVSLPAGAAANYNRFRHYGNMGPVSAQQRQFMESNAEGTVVKMITSMEHDIQEQIKKTSDDEKAQIIGRIDTLEKTITDKLKGGGSDQEVSGIRDMVSALKQSLDNANTALKNQQDTIASLQGELTSMKQKEAEAAKQEAEKAVHKSKKATAVVARHEGPHWQPNDWKLRGYDASRNVAIIQSPKNEFYEESIGYEGRDDKGAALSGVGTLNGVEKMSSGNYVLHTSAGDIYEGS